MGKHSGMRLKVLLNYGLHKKGKTAGALRDNIEPPSLLWFRRFPAISGFRLTWDSRRDPGNRVLGMWLMKPNYSSEEASFQADEEPIERVAGGRKYKIVTREYMAQGHDGFSMLTKGQLLIDHESGAIMSSIVRKYMLGRINILLYMILNIAYRFSICKQSHSTEGTAHSSSREDEGGHRPTGAEAKGGIQTPNKCSCSPMGTCNVVGSSSNALPKSYGDLYKRAHDYCRCIWWS